MSCRRSISVPYLLLALASRAGADPRVVAQETGTIVSPETIIVIDKAPDPDAAPAARDRDRALGDAPFVTVVHPDEHPETASTLSMLGRSLVLQKRFDEAAPMLQRSLAIQEHVYGPAHPKVANILNELASVSLQRNRLDEAEPLFQRVVEIYRKAYGDRHYRVALAISNTASVYLNRKQYARAEAMYRDAIERYRQTLPAGHAYIAIAEIKLGRVLVFERRYGEAETHTMAGYRELAKQANPSVSWLQSARKDLVAIYEALHEPEKAVVYR